MNPITVLYFGDLMSQFQIGRESLRLPAAVKDVAGLMKVLAMRGGDWQAAFAPPRASVRITVNKKDAEGATSLSPGDEDAFIEMVSV